MKPLISPEEVVEIALGGEDNFRSTSVTEAVIISAQQKFIRPVFNALYDALEKGAYPEFLNCHIKTPLAYYVKYLLLPSIAAQVGASGVVQASGTTLAPVGNTALRRVMQRTKSDADALIEAAIEHVECHKDDYPEYNRKYNVKNRRSLQSNILL